jgi:hypothetical protein
MIRSKIFELTQLHWYLQFLLIIFLIIVLNLLIVNFDASIYVINSKIISMFGIEEVEEFDVGFIKIDFSIFCQILKSSIRINQILIIISDLVEISREH